MLVFTLIAHATEVDSVFARAYALLDSNYEGAIDQVAKANENIDSYSADEQEQFHHQAAQFYRRVGHFELESNHWKKKIDLIPLNSDTLHATLLSNGAALINLGRFDQALTTYQKCRDYYLLHPNLIRLSESFNGIATVTGISRRHRKFY